MQARLQDVAVKAEVSAQTVSRVLRAPHLVAPDTAERVRAVMMELGYFGNQQATALRLGRTHTIGLLFPLHDSLPMPFPLEVIAGAEERAFARGYSLVMCDSSGPPEREAESLSVLLSQRVAGIIYTAPRCRPETHPACARLLKSGVPVVVISSDPRDLPYGHVRTDDRRAGYVAVRHLLDLGRRRIAVVAGAGPPIDDRLDGATTALREAHLAPGETPLYVGPETADGGRAAAEAIVARPVPWPDGIFVTTDIMALGLLEVLRSAGLRVPEDSAVVGHDDLFAASIAVPALTTIAPPRRQMGQHCVDLLLAGEDTAPMVHVLDAELVVRESTIGSGAGARSGLRTPLSVPEPWSAWRRQRATVRSHGPGAPAGITTSTLGRRGEIGSSPPRAAPRQDAAQVR